MEQCMTCHRRGSIRARSGLGNVPVVSVVKRRGPAAGVGRTTFRVRHASCTKQASVRNDLGPHFSHSIMTELDVQQACRILSRGVGQPEMP